MSDSLKLQLQREDFIRRHILLADEAFLAGSEVDENKLISAARRELGFSDSTWNNDIKRSLLSAYKNVTHLQKV